MVRSARWIAANGDIIYFNQSPPYMLATFFPGTPSARPDAVKGIRADGQTTYHVARDPLTPSITGSIHSEGKTYEEAQRNLDKARMRLQRALDPTQFGTLIYKSFAGSFRLVCRPITGAEINNRIGNVYNFDVEFISDDPYWTAATPSAISVGEVKKLWRFPWAIKPTVFGSLLSRGSIKNPTHIDIYPKIYISDTQSTKVTVGNETTGDTITIAHNIDVGQRLIIDMAVPSVVLTGDGINEDVTHWLTHDSAFPWVVVPGVNDIYSAVDNPDRSPIISIMWYQPEGL